MVGSEFGAVNLERRNLASRALEIDASRSPAALKQSSPSNLWASLSRLMDASTSAWLCRIRSSLLATGDAFQQVLNVGKPDIAQDEDGDHQDSKEHPGLPEYRGGRTAIS